MKSHLLIALCCATIATLATPLQLSAETEADENSFEFIKGYNWGWIGKNGDYAGPAAADSMAKLAETGSNWTCITFGARMETQFSTEIKWAENCDRMVSDSEIRHAIGLARQHGLKVIMKPNIVIDDNTWRAWIKFFRPLTPEEVADGKFSANDPWRLKQERGLVYGKAVDQDKWDLWWESFSAFMLHYATLAEEENIPIFCLGGELISTESFEAKWRGLIAEVRKVYSGKLTYNANHNNELGLTWWDAVDFPSVSAYYGMFPEDEIVESMIHATTPVEELKAHFQKQKGRLRLLHMKTKNPVLFIETGVTNIMAASRYPWSHLEELTESPVNDQEQANFYQAMLESFWDEPWFMGYCWWDWPSELYAPGDPEHRSFCVYGKPAEAILRTWYAKDHAPIRVKSR